MTSLLHDKGSPHDEGPRPPSAFAGLSTSVLSALELAVVLSGDVASGTAVVAEAVRSRPKAATGSRSAARADLIVATSEISALHRFSGGVDLPERWTGRTDLSRRDLVLARAFACRLGWQAQASLWAVDVAKLPPRAVRRPLGRGDLAMDLVRNELRHAYLELRGDLPEECTVALRHVFRAVTTKMPTPEDHLATCERCRSEAAWLAQPAAVLERVGTTLSHQVNLSLQALESRQATASEESVPEPFEERVQAQREGPSRLASVGRVPFVTRRGIAAGGRRRGDEPQTTAQHADRAHSPQITTQIIPASDHLLFVRLDRPPIPAPTAEGGDGSRGRWRARGERSRTEQS